jgi:hypothetical protein
MQAIDDGLAVGCKPEVINTVRDGAIDIPDALVRVI